jgi:undecaprenyl-phosphate 4-deoxy-4-formamido-L-arabinose transferase
VTALRSQHLAADPIEVSVVVPVYRAATTLQQLVERLNDVFERIDVSYELILVEDDGGDQSWDVMQRLQRCFPDRITAVQLMRNYGQHNALMCAFARARGRIIVTLDDDLQHPPEEIPKLLRKLQDGGYDLVYGIYEAKKHARGRNVASSIVNLFFRFVFRTSVCVTAFRAIRRELVDAILTYNLNFTYIDGLLAWNTRRIGEQIVEHKPRLSGRSGYTFGKLLTLALNLFTNFSLLPLQLATGVGLFAAVGGLATACYYLAQSLSNNITVPGYASIIVAVLVLGGLQLLALGVIGEYVGRLHLNVNRKPQYTVRHIFGPHDEFRAGVESLNKPALPVEHKSESSTCYL